MELRRLPVLVVAGMAGAAALSSLRTLGFAFWMDAFPVMRELSERGPWVLGRYRGNPSTFLRPLWNAGVLALLELFGAEPAGYHAVSLALHLLTLLLLFAWLREVAGGPGPALTAAALWATFAWNAFQVAWVCPLMPELMATPLALASLLCFWRGLERAQPAATALAVGLFLASALAKESTLTLPFFFWVAARLAFGLDVRRATLHLSGFWLVLALYAAVRVFLFGAQSVPLRLSGATLSASGAAGVLAAGVVTGLSYLRQLLFSVIPVPIVTADAEGALFVVAALAVLAGVVSLAARGPRWPEGARRLALLGLAWWLLLSLPSAVSSHPRTMYQSGMGVAMMLAAALEVAVLACDRRPARLLALSALAAAFLGAHVIMNLRVQDRFRGDGPSTLAVYASEYRRVALFRPRTEFESALREHVRGHLARQGCLDGVRLLPHCREKTSYDLNPVLDELRLGRRLRPFLPGLGQSR